MENTDHMTPDDGDRLRDLLNQYRNVEVVHPVVSTLCEVAERKEVFQKCLTHDFYVLRERSQDLANSEISIYQKAFVILMGKEEDRIGGIEIYVDELLGLRLVDSARAPQTLATAVNARGLMQNIPCRNGPSQPPLIRKGGPLLPDSGEAFCEQLHEPNRSTKSRPLKEEPLFLSQNLDVESPRFAKAPDATSPQDTDFFVIDTSGKAAPQPKPASLSDDPKLDRLWELYQAARQEFMKSRTDCFRRTTDAKFLRDTAENCINYVEASKSAVPPHDLADTSPHPKHNSLDPEKLQELRATLEEAIKVAEKGSGGKKRRFDHDEIDAPRNPKKMTPTPRINDSASSKPYDLTKDNLKFPNDKHGSKNPYNPPGMVHMLPLRPLVKKNPSGPATVTPLSSPVFREPQDNAPMWIGARRASFYDPPRSPSPRESGLRYRTYGGYRRPYGGGYGSQGRRNECRRLPFRQGDCYRPSY